MFCGWENIRGKRGTGRRSTSDLFEFGEGGGKLQMVEAVERGNKTKFAQSQKQGE